MARFSRRSFPVRSQRRLVSWEDGPSNTGTNLTSSVAALGSTAQELTAERVTLIRLRGSLSLYLPITSAALSGFRGAVGVAIASAEAIAAGVTAVPTPFLDADLNLWWWHSFFDIRSITATIADGANAAAVVVRIPVDTKAMRKISQTETVFVAIEVIEEGTASLRWGFESRQLVKLA